MKIYLVSALIIAALMICPVSAESSKTQTSLGLYVTAKEAYGMWEANPEKVKILDVRTLAEYIFVGHAPMAYSIPAFFQTRRWDDSKKWFAMEPNPDFVAQVMKWANPSETILVTCRSGERAARAVNLLAEAGFKNVYNIVDGMEGELIKDPESVFYGRRMKNGWKNSGLPLTYELNPKQIWVPDKQ